MTDSGTAPGRGRRAALLLAALLSLAACGESEPSAALAERGKALFAESCATCHAAEERRNGPGPHLVGLLGRQAGSVEGFRYSPAMAGAGLVWNADTMKAFLADPRGYLPGNRMGFSGLEDPGAVDALLAYLRSVAPGS